MSFLDEEKDKLRMKEEMIPEAAKRLGDIRTQIPLDLADIVIQGMSRFPFTEWIEEEVKPRDFALPTFYKFNKKTDPISHLM